MLLDWLSEGGTLTNMGLFNRSKKVEVNRVSRPRPVFTPPQARDERVAACPSCGAELKKVPGAATKCPHCHEVMFVRTDPRYNTRRVLTAEGARDVDDERAKRDGTWEFVKAGRDREVATRKKLGVQFKMSPESVSDNDVQWAILNENAVEAMKHANWLDYMFVQWDIAIELSDRCSTERAASFMVWACYLRMNDPNNMHPQGVDMASVYKPFSPKPEFGQVSGELQSIRRVFDELGVSVDEGLEKCSAKAEREGQSIHLPLPWAQARELMYSWLNDPPT